MNNEDLVRLICQKIATENDLQTIRDLNSLLVEVKELCILSALLALLVC